MLPARPGRAEGQQDLDIHYGLAPLIVADEANEAFGHVQTHADTGVRQREREREHGLAHEYRLPALRDVGDRVQALGRQRAHLQVMPSLPPVAS
jgi:hypothetical protein